MARRNTLKWFEEMRQWVEGSDLEKLRAFLLENGITRKMNLSQTRKQALQVLDRLQIQVSLRARENATARRKPPVANPEAEVEPESPKYVSEELLTEVVRDLKGEITSLRDQTDAQAREAREVLRKLEESTSPLRKTVGVLALGLADLQMRLGEKASKVGLVSKQDLEAMIEKARVDWQSEVRDAIESLLEGKEKRKFLEWWNKIVTWFDEPVSQQDNEEVG